MLKKIKNLYTSIFWSISRRMYLSIRNDLPTQDISESEKNTIKNFSSKNKDAKILFDIGANIGSWSKMATKINDNVIIYSFEPIKSTYRNLQNNCKKNNNIKTINMALSSENGLFDIYSYGENEGTNSLYKDNIKNPYTIEKIETNTIDSFCNENNIDKIDFIKCDTEGNDFKVIFGAKNMFKEGKIGVLQFEYNWRWILSNSNIKQVFDIFQKTNYVLGKITVKEVQIIKEWNQELDKFFEANYIIIHKDFIKYFEHNFYFFNKKNILQLR